MHPLIGACPVCGETLAVTRLHCRNCDTTIEGHFAIGVFERLTAEQLAFAATFIKNDGKLNRMATDLDLSYPTLRIRLDELRRAMGFAVEEDEAPAAAINDEQRRQILDDLAAGRIKSEDAIKLLQTP
jgi:hypothetical protein